MIQRKKDTYIYLPKRPQRYIVMHKKKETQNTHIEEVKLYFYTFFIVQYDIVTHVSSRANFVL